MVEIYEASHIPNVIRQVGVWSLGLYTICSEAMASHPHPLKPLQDSAP